MSGSDLRRALRARPRLVLAVLLALAIQTLAAGGPIGHRHAGGDARHVHAGRIVGAASPAPRGTHADGGGAPAIATAQADGWHEHVAPATFAAAARPAATACHLTAGQLSSEPVVAPPSSDGRAAHARGPPARIA